VKLEVVSHWSVLGTRPRPPQPDALLVGYFFVLAVKKTATYADLVALPPQLVGEIIDGELIASPRPAMLHARAASRLGMDLGGPFDRGKGGPGGWIILDEPELHIVEQVLVPDLAGWRRERMPEMPDAAYVELAPDWICEVLSPATAKIDRADKMRHYAAAGVRHLWLVDPLATTLEIYRLDGGGWRLVQTHAGAEAIRGEPFDAVELDLGSLWSR
jgi:Uma2 family endonuclease